MGKSSIQFSIVIAAWNAEKTIQKAVGSVTSQLEDDYEILIIDDCSTDRTFLEISLLSQKNPKIKIYKNKNNLGPSESRNLGIKKARGCYIGFLDSDDWYEDGLFDRLHLEIVKNRPDVIKFGVKEIYKNFERFVMHTSFFISNPKEITREAISLETLPLFGYASNSFYKTDALIDAGITFDKDLRFAEDFFFNFELFQHIHTASFIDLYGYNYTKTSSNSLSQKKIKDFDLLYKKKISLLIHWAQKNDCFNSAGEDILAILVKIIYSSVVRNLGNRQLREVYQELQSFFQMEEFDKLTPFFPKSLNFNNFEYLAVKWRSWPLVLIFSIFLKTISAFNLSFIKKFLKNKGSKKSKKSEEKTK